ncbi:MAG: zinc metalloprotease HtpX [Oligoflexia bacterium]|nr:zinc metalloprotease HtpX [Oligoflexia bacterium]
MSNQIRTFVLLGALSALLIAIGGLLGPGYVLPFTIFAVLMNLGAYYFSDSIVLRMHGAREVSPSEGGRLYSIVQELSQRAQLPMPRVYIIPSAEANAFATGRNPEHGVVAVTEGILRILDERELRGVIAHELAHIKNRDILISTIAAIGAAAISSLAQALQFAALFGSRDSESQQGGAVQSLALIILAPLAATLLQMGISRSREYMADRLGAEICGDPEGLARALERLHRRTEMVESQFQPATASLYIVNPFAAAGGILHLFSTHPPVERRIELLQAMMRGQVAA